MQTNPLSILELLCNISIGIITVVLSDCFQLEYKHQWKMAKYYHFCFGWPAWELNNNTILPVLLRPITQIEQI